MYQFTGDPNRIARLAARHARLGREVQERGAGEIVLNCMASDGVRRGYDIEQLAPCARSATCRWSPRAAPARRSTFATLFEQAQRRCGAGRQRVPLRRPSRFRDLKRALRRAASRCDYDVTCDPD